MGQNTFESNTDNIAWQRNVESTLRGRVNGYGYFTKGRWLVVAKSTSMKNIIG